MVSQVHAPLAQLLNGAVIVFAAAAMMLLSSVEVDLWLWGYAVSVGITLLWAGSAPEDQGVAGSGRGFLSDMFYPVGLVSTSLEMALVLVFIGFDYCPGLFLLVRNPDTIHIPQPSSTLLPPPLFGFCRAKFTFQHSGPCGKAFSPPLHYPLLWNRRSHTTHHRSSSSTPPHAGSVLCSSRRSSSSPT